MGYYSILFARKAINGTVYAIEPDLKNYSTLIENIEINKITNIIPSNLALGGEDKNVSLIKESAQNNGLIYIDEIGANSNIPMLTLDNFLKVNKIKHISFIKVDIEGYEYNFLLGAKNTIVQFQPIIYIEINDTMLKTYNSSASEVISFLITLGYNVFDSESGKSITNKTALIDCFLMHFVYSMKLVQALIDNMYLKLNG